MPLIPAFQLHLNNPILHKLATVGKYDGKHPSLTCATSGGKVFIHSPHERDEESTHQVRFLNINRRITALCSGRLKPSIKRDTLMVGTQTNLLAYDVEKNSDTFYKEVPDGVNACVFGQIPSIDSPLAIVGGNCSIQGFNVEGNELFWTVTGDNVTALTFLEGEERKELLVGSDDFEIRIFQQEEVINEITETDRITSLAPIQRNLFAYALGNGTIGMYERTTRIWRVKSKNSSMALGSFDLDGDGVREVITGWSNGKLDVRHVRNGKIIFKDIFSSPISSIVEADYRMDGREEVIVCALDGEVRGYLPVSPEAAPALAAEEKKDAGDPELARLLKRKADMQMELRGLEENLKQSREGGGGAGVIPSDTKVNATLDTAKSKNSYELNLATTNDTLVKAAVVLTQDGGLFQGETLFAYPTTPSKSLRIPLTPKKNVAMSLRIQIMVSARGNSSQYHVFDKELDLPKFSMFVLADERTLNPTSSVTLYITERPNRVIMWLMQNFLGCSSVRAQNNELSVGFTSVSDGRPLLLKMTPERRRQDHDWVVTTWSWRRSWCRTWLVICR